MQGYHPPPLFGLSVSTLPLCEHEDDWIGPFPPPPSPPSPPLFHDYYDDTCYTSSDDESREISYNGTGDV